ncbi:MAG: S1C family serine protease [Gemmataceae bacterium]
MRTRNCCRNHVVAAVLLGGMAAIVLSAGARADLDPRVLDVEAQRVAVVEKVKPSVVAIFSRGGQGGGSGVIIDEHGYALTNFHVVQGSGPVMQCGLADGILYDAVLVGLDKVGDVALIKLLPKKPGDKFHYSVMGDSDKLKAGDWSLAMGNPFLLATDFTPTVTYGLISGVNRYQYPAGTLLEYTDCIQIDTSINPGNSGGPLFNMAGELIGINGRGSFEKRGRVNSGVGYAISINQIKNFLGHLYAGIDTDHATLGAMVESDATDDGFNTMVVRSILSDCDARRRGLNFSDELVSFAGRPMTSVNQFKNVLGLYPKGWRVPLVYRRDNERREILARLMGVQARVIEEGRPQPPQPQPNPRQPRPAPRLPNTPAAKLYEPKPGFANFHFNKLERDKLLAAFAKSGDFSKLTGPWQFDADMETRLRKTNAQAFVGDVKAPDGKTKVVSRMVVGGIEYELEPLKVGQEEDVLRSPPGSGGLLLALYHYRRLLTMGEKGFEGEFSHGGHEPFYPPRVDGTTPKSLNELRVDCAVLRTEHSGIFVKWYFSLQDNTLLGCELYVDQDEDPCEVYFYDYRPVAGRQLPHRILVHYGNERYATIQVKNYQLAAAN